MWRWGYEPQDIVLNRIRSRAAEESATPGTGIPVAFSDKKGAL
jgi:hypothetical protein